MLSYVFPMSLMILAAAMLTLKGLKEQGRLGRFFGKVTICDQPPSNTIQKIIAVKDAMRDVENYLQNLNVMLLKIRTIFLSGHPQVCSHDHWSTMLTASKYRELLIDIFMRFKLGDFLWVFVCVFFLAIDIGTTKMV